MKSSKPPCSVPAPTGLKPPHTGSLKAWEDLTIADDYMFKLVMSHKRICKHLLEIILGIKIRKLIEPETEKAVKIGYESKGIRLDVYVEDDANTVYDIEMQVRRYPEATLGRRTRYYQSVIDFGALQVGVEYHQLKKSILIFICPFPLFDGQRHIYTFKDTCQEDTSLLLDNGTSKIFLSTKGKLNDVSPEVKNFLDFVEGLPVQDNWVDEIRDLITQLKNTEKEKVNYMTYQMKIAEERAEARAEGQAEGRAEGFNQVAISMLKDHKPLEEIIRYTRLSLEQIQKLANQIQSQPS